MKLMVGSVVIAFMLSFESAAALEACAVSDLDVEKAGSYADAVKLAVMSAPDCSTAFITFENCQLGSAGDNELADTVKLKCEPLFLNQANPRTKRAYGKAQSRCDRIAKKNAGSMYQSAAAVCLAGIARDFARKQGKAD
jgi:hypothetical protein